MLYELRLYQPYDGRMPDLLRRFREQTPALFARHGIDCLGIWQTESEVSTLVYLTRHTGFAERDAAWSAFAADPQWHAARRDSNAGSEMLQNYELYFLKPRPGMAEPPQQQGRIHELIFLPTRHGQVSQVTDWLHTTLTPHLQACGASLVHCLDMLAGCQLPQLALMIGWPVEPAMPQRELAPTVRLPAQLAPMDPVQASPRRITLDRILLPPRGC
jgi:hypothetical protein